MIRHFDSDEAGLIEFAEKIYRNGFIPLDGWTFGYPQLFYYIGGLVLFPYTILKGTDYQVITIILRSLNTLAVGLTVPLFYFFCLRFFKSIYVAIIGSLLLITTPEYLYWMVNSRPHPLEIFFILIAFDFNLKLVEGYQPKFLAMALVFSSIATSVKYGGIFLIPTIWLACCYNVWSLETQKLIDYLKLKFKFIFSLSATISLSVILIAGALSTFIYQGVFCKFGIRNLKYFLSIKNARLICAFLLLLFLFGVVWLIFNLLSIKFSRNSNLSTKHHCIFAFNKSFLVLIYIISITILLFIILNPTYWLFPLATIKGTAIQFALTSMSTSLDRGVNKPIFNLEGVVWLRRLFDRNLLGGWIGLLFLFYSAYEIFSLKKNWVQDKRFVFQRGLLLTYVLCLFFVLFFLVSHRPLHYLLPITIVILMLTSFGAVEIIRRSQMKLRRNFLLSFFIILLTSGLYTRGAEIVKLRNVKLQRGEKDTGVIIGDWLKKNFPAGIKIWKDYFIFYIPPNFDNVFSSRRIRYIELDEIRRVDPDILILTSPTTLRQLEELLKMDKLLSYRQIKHIKYLNKLEDFSDIYIIAKSSFIIERRIFERMHK